MRNLNVIACNEIDGFYYPGFVSGADNGEDKILVRFYDIKPGSIGREDVIYIGGAVACPELKIGDYALVRVMCRTTRAEYYVPGVVIVLPQGHAYETRFYTLQIYNGRFVEKMRRNIVKIAPEKYAAIFRYIAELRYGVLRRSVTVQSLTTNRERKPKQKRRWNSSSLLMLYPHKKEKINVFRLYDKSKEKYQYTERKHGRALEHQEKKKNPGRSYPKPCQSDEDINVRSFSTSYSNDSLTRTDPAEKVGKAVLRQSSDTLRSVESMKSDTTIGERKRDSTPTGERKQRKSAQSAKVVKEKRKQNLSESSCSSSRVSNQDNITKTTLSSRILKPNQEVLARWSDDGWYYRGVVVKGDGEDKYLVKDSTGHSETILLDDILLDSDTEFQVIEPFNHVIALHPNYVFSYAPAIIKDVYRNGVTVVFYDKVFHKLPMSEVYKISHIKYRRDVEYMKDRENGLTQSVAIARDDKTGFYNKCEIVCPVGVNQKFIVKWPNGDLAQQSGNNIFSVDTGNLSKQTTHWEYVLAPTDATLSQYLPAEVIQTNPFRMKIFNESRLIEGCSHQCVWLNKAYYNNAVNFYNNIHTNL